MNWGRGKLEKNKSSKAEQQKSKRQKWLSETQWYISIIFQTLEMELHVRINLIATSNAYLGLSVSK